MRIAAGKVLMDRNAPEKLRDSAQRGYDDSKALLARWHGRARCLYAITPRFAGTSTPAQLDAAGALWREHPDVLVQTHIAENRREIDGPNCFLRNNYLDIYDTMAIGRVPCCPTACISPRASYAAARERPRGATARPPPVSLLRLFGIRAATDRAPPLQVARHGYRRAHFSLLATMGAVRDCTLTYARSAPSSISLPTLGGARALALRLHRLDAPGKNRLVCSLRKPRRC